MSNTITKNDLDDLVSHLETEYTHMRQSAGHMCITNAPHAAAVERRMAVAKSLRAAVLGLGAQVPITDRSWVPNYHGAGTLA